MSWTLDWLVANAVIAGVLAVAVALLVRWPMRPAARHLLWLIVLVKFITPPLVCWDLPIAGNLLDPKVPITASGATPSDELSPLQPIESSGNLAPRVAPLGSDAEQSLESPLADGYAGRSESAADPAANLAVSPADASDRGESSQRMASGPAGLPAGNSAAAREWSLFGLWQWAGAVLPAVWLCGSLAWLATAGFRLARLHLRMRRLPLADRSLQAMAREVSGRMGLARLPAIRITEAGVPPLLAATPRGSTMVLPRPLLANLDLRQQMQVVAHELAHFRRGDQWVRWLEFVVLGIYWWHPAAWFARRQLQEAEEHCCDAWVLQSFPDHARGYAEALLATVDFLAEARTPALAGACTLGPLSSLKRRLTMIVERPSLPELSYFARAALAALALAILPCTWRLAAQETKPAPQGQSVPVPVEKNYSVLGLPEKGAPPNAGADTIPAGAGESVERRLDRLEQALQKLIDAQTPAPKIGPTKSDRALRGVGQRYTIKAPPIYAVDTAGLDETIASLEKQLAELKAMRAQRQEETKKSEGAGVPVLKEIPLLGKVFVKKEGADERPVDGLLIGHDEEQLVAVDARSRKLVWTFAVKGELPGVQTITNDGKVVCVTGSDGRQLWLNAQTGKVLERTKLEQK